MQKKGSELKEPSVVIRPIGRLGGLDNLHITLLIALAVLMLLAALVAYSKPVTIANITNCTYGSANNTCITPLHNASFVGALAERVLASYATVNSSLSLIPFISNVSTINAAFVPQSRAWLVSLSARNLGSNQTFRVAFLISDTDTSQITPLLQTAKPSMISNNSVVSLGVVRLNDKPACGANSTQVYWFVDPYAVGALKSLQNATALETQFGSKVNLTVKIVAGADTQRIASSYGLGNAEALGMYAFCASQQSGFSSFVSNLNSLYSGSYLSANVLSNIANFSNLNRTALNSCLGGAVPKINAQGLLAQYFNITQTPVAIVSCQYLAIPQTAKQAVCYASKAC